MNLFLQSYHIQKNEEQKKIQHMVKKMDPKSQFELTKAVRQSRPSPHDIIIYMSLP